MGRILKAINQFLYKRIEPKDMPPEENRTEKSKLEAGLRFYRFKGDVVQLRPIQGGELIRIVFPCEDVVEIPRGTKGVRYQYFSPSDKATRSIRIGYIDNRCRITLDN